jgi:hypothetical protein
MYKDNISHNQYINYSNSRQRIGVGSQLSEQIPVCWTCRNRGWPHESITFQKLPNGEYLKLDYFSGRAHIHKDRKEERLN